MYLGYSPFLQKAFCIMNNMLFLFKNVNNFLRKIVVLKKKVVNLEKMIFSMLHDSSNIRIHEGRSINQLKIVDFFVVEKLHYFVQLSMHTVGKFMTKKVAL